MEGEGGKRIERGVKHCMSRRDGLGTNITFIQYSITGNRLQSSVISPVSANPVVPRSSRKNKPFDIKIFVTL